MIQFDEMEIGDSFLTELTATGRITVSRTLAERRTGFKFRAALVDGFVRVWRVK